ncbi:MAG: Holliday junction resolvase Hjc [Candidatus Woesearchaeota archaeon]|jgi:Holliday junction resolvase|nr:Holliday junction resolvase Hjc [Candidatus Woesearchaeota archaeon]MDP7457791.1 Holliday junction resolvase Hjc [Candidatus Woesearchaeota archaeon]
MSRKSKGINAERELVHFFWKHGLAALRVAGSGSMRYPAPDVIVGNPKKRVVIECKACKGKIQYFTAQEIKELSEFAALFDALPYVGVRFDNKGWIFQHIKDLRKSGNLYGLGADVLKNTFSSEDIVKTFE